MSDRSDSPEHEQSPEDRNRKRGDLIAGGLRQPIDILPNGQIESGHQRYAVAKAWQLTHVTVRVQHE